MRRTTVGRVTAFVTGVLVATTLVAAPMTAGAEDGDKVVSDQIAARITAVLAKHQ